MVYHRWQIHYTSLETWLKTLKTRFQHFGDLGINATISNQSVFPTPVEKIKNRDNKVK